MRRFVSILIVVFLTLFAFRVPAQVYVLDDCFADSISFHKIEKTADGETIGAEAFKLPLGEKVTISRCIYNKDKTYAYPCIKVDGKEYISYGKYFVFSDDNLEDVEDPMAGMFSGDNHTWVAKFYASPTPYLIIVALFVVAIGMAFMGIRIQKLRSMAVKAVPGLILVAVLLEIHAIMTHGNDTFWWCDPERLGFFGSLLMLFPYVAVVAAQLFSLKIYRELLLGQDDDDLSIRPMAISLAVSIPATIIMMLVSLECFDMSKLWAAIVTILTFVLSLGVGIWISTKRNIATLGKARGIAFSVFAGIYAIGAIVAVYGLAVVVIQLIFQIIMACAIVFGVAYLLSMGGGSGEGSRYNYTTTTTYWTDCEGNKFTNEEDAKSSNRRIAERRADS